MSERLYDDYYPGVPDGFELNVGGYVIEVNIDNCCVRKYPSDPDLDHLAIIGPDGECLAIPFAPEQAKNIKDWAHRIGVKIAEFDVPDELTLDTFAEEGERRLNDEWMLGLTGTEG